MNRVEFVTPRREGYQGLDLLECVPINSKLLNRIAECKFGNFFTAFVGDYGSVVCLGVSPFPVRASGSSAWFFASKFFQLFLNLPIVKWHNFLILEGMA